MLEYDISQPWHLRLTKRKAMRSHWWVKRLKVSDVFQGEDTIFSWCGNSICTEPGFQHEIRAHVTGDVLIGREEKGWFRRDNNHRIYDVYKKTKLKETYFIENFKKNMNSKIIVGCAHKQYEIIINNNDYIIPDVCEITVSKRQEMGVIIRVIDELYVNLSVIMAYELGYSLWSAFSTSSMDFTDSGDFSDL